MLYLSRSKTIFKTSLTVSLLFLIIATLVLTMSSVSAYWRGSLHTIPEKNETTQATVHQFFPMHVNDWTNGQYNVHYGRVVRKDGMHFIPVYEGNEKIPNDHSWAHWYTYRRISKYYYNTDGYEKGQVILTKNNNGGSVSYDVYECVRTQPPRNWFYWNSFVNGSTTPPLSGTFSTYFNTYFKKRTNLTINTSPVIPFPPASNNIVYVHFALYYPGDIVYNVNNGYFYQATSNVATAHPNYAKGNLFKITNINKPPEYHNNGEHMFWQRLRFVHLGETASFETDEVVVTTKIINGNLKVVYYKYVGTNHQTLTFSEATTTNSNYFIPFINNNETRE